MIHTKHKLEAIRRNGRSEKRPLCDFRRSRLVFVEREREKSKETTGPPLFFCVVVIGGFRIYCKYGGFFFEFIAGFPGTRYF